MAVVVCEAAAKCELGIQQIAPNKHETVINLKTTKTPDLTFPPTVIARSTAKPTRSFWPSTVLRIASNSNLLRGGSLG